MKNINVESSVIFYWGLCVATYSIIHYVWMPDVWGKQAISDAGIFSILTMAIIASAFIRLVYCAQIVTQKNQQRLLYALAYIVLIYGLREADFHRLFTEEHITRGKFYTNPEIALLPKILGGVPLLVFFSLFLFTIIRYAGFALNHLKKCHAWAIALALWFITLFTSQLFDRSDLNHTYGGRVAEEMLEFCAAGYIFISIYLGTKLLLANTAINSHK
jgi:hypothetical protein